MQNREIKSFQMYSKIILCTNIIFYICIEEIYEIQNFILKKYIYS